jgi:predicted ribosomally synthesized peptide with SipW-like signal peptide
MKKIKWIMLALVLCLGLVGGAYAAWSETLHINGTVDVAKWDVRFVTDTEIVQERANNNDSWTRTIYAGAPDDSPLAYGSTTAVIIEYDEFEIVLSDVYPGYESLVDVTIINDSTIPVQVLLVGYYEQFPDGDTSWSQFKSTLKSSNGLESGNWITMAPGEEVDIYIENVVLSEAESEAEYGMSWKIYVQQGIGSTPDWP